MSAPSAAEALYRELPASLTIHPYQVDVLRDAVMMIRLTENAFSEASFLDRRLIGTDTAMAWFSWEQIAARMAGQKPGCLAHYIFHVGHCGSTLVSRLLGELGVLGIREPLPLRTLAEIHAELESAECRWSSATFDVRLALLARLFDRGQERRAVKATSFCNDLATLLLRSEPSRRATIVHTRLHPYLANVLAGPNSRLDVLSAAPMRLKRLAAHAGGPVDRLSQMSQATISAMTWVTEMVALTALAGTCGDRVLVVDFDRFLDNASAGLRSLADHVVPGVTERQIAAVVAGPSLTRYSKAPEHAYDAELRRRVLADGEARFGDEIRAGIHWCEQLASRAPAVARALDLFDRSQNR